MLLEIIKGAVNTSRTWECIKRIDALKEKNPDARILFVVPEQFSYSAEKLFVSYFGGTGLNNIEVMTMSRMAERCLNRVRKNYLTQAGKAVLIQKAINDINKEENVYGGCSDKPGFSSTVSDTITELKRCLITPQILIECAEKTENNMLKSKLTSIAEIYSRYQEMNLASFYDAEEDLTRLSVLIENEKIFENAYVFVDDYVEFYPQHYRVLESIIRTAKALTLTLPIDENDLENSKIPKDTLRRLKKICEKNSCNFLETELHVDKSFFESEEIEFYFNNYTKFRNRDFEPYEEKTEDICLYMARDPYSEVENVATKIRRLVDEQGYRYKDIVVSCGNLDEYINILQAVFDEYKISYFSDVKVSVTEHPIILTVMSLFDIIGENWNYDSVFKYLKTGFIYKEENGELTQLSMDDIDLLDSYVLKYGIKGKKKWTQGEDWNFKSSSISDVLSEYQKSDEEKNKKINEIRNEVIAPIKRFIEKTSGKNTVIKIASSLFEFFEEIKLYDGIQAEIIHLSRNNMMNEAEQLSQVWNIMITVLDQITTALGDIKCSRDDFKKYFYSALSVNEIAIIPPMLDGVSICAANAYKNNSQKIMFILGAVKGVVPLEKSEEGIFSDSDRRELDSLLIDDEREIGGDTGYYRASEEYKLFRVLFSAKKKLFISYPLNDFDGVAQMPSQIILDLRKIFKNFTQISELTSDNEKDNYFTVDSAFDYLLKNRNNKRDKLVKSIYKWFLENEEDKLEVIKNADLYKKERAKITPKNAEQLYGEMLDYSASRLKVYADCPFKYFMQYGLGAKPEEVWQIQKFDLGTIMHYIVCKYCETVDANSKDFDELRRKWKELTDAESDKIIDTIIGEVTKSIVNSLGKDEDKINYLLMRIKKIIKRSIELVRISLTKGEYQAVEYEKSFRIKLDSDDRSVGVKGTIDRIDIAMADSEKAGIRVVDYKSGKKDFSVVSVCNMQDVQLVLYATAAAELFKMGNIKYSNPSVKGKVTGIMYNKLKDNFVEANGADKEKINEELLKEMKLNGVIILDSDIDDKNNEQFDISDAVLMDSDIEEMGESSYLKFKLTNGGQPYQTSEVMSRNSFEKMTEYVKKKIINTDSEIRGGNIEILPYVESNASACDYCEMKEVCLFDKDKDASRKLCDSQQDAWEIIDEELKK